MKYKFIRIETTLLLLFQILITKFKKMFRHDPLDPLLKKGTKGTTLIRPIK